MAEKGSNTPTKDNLEKLQQQYSRTSSYEKKETAGKLALNYMNDQVKNWVEQASSHRSPQNIQQPAPAVNSTPAASAAQNLSLQPTHRNLEEAPDLEGSQRSVRDYLYGLNISVAKKVDEIRESLRVIPDEQQGKGSQQDAQKQGAANKSPEKLATRNSAVSLENAPGFEQSAQQALHAQDPPENGTASNQQVAVSGVSSARKSATDVQKNAAGGAGAGAPAPGASNTAIAAQNVPASGEKKNDDSALQPATVPAGAPAEDKKGSTTPRKTGQGVKGDAPPSDQAKAEGEKRASDEKAQLQATIDALRAQVKEHTDKNKTLQDRVSQLEEERSTQRDAFNALKDKLTRLEAQQVKWEGERKALNNKIAELEDGVRREQQARQDAEKQQQLTVSQVQSEQQRNLEAARAENDALREQNKDLEDRFQKADKELRKYKDQSNEVLKELQQTHKNLSFYKQEADRMQTSQLGFVQKSERVVELENQLFKLEHQIQLVNDQKLEMLRESQLEKVKFEELKNEVRKLEITNQILKATLDETQRRYRVDQDRTEELKQKFYEMKGAKEVIIAQIEKELDAQGRTIDQKMRENEEMRLRIKQLETENRMYKESYATTVQTLMKKRLEMEAQDSDANETQKEVVAEVLVGDNDQKKKIITTKR